MVDPGGVADGSSVPDTVATIALFVVLTPSLLAVAGVIGVHMFMLGDGHPTSRVSIAAIFVAVIGPFLGTLALNVAAAVWALAAAGTTFFIPLLAAAASALWTFGICGAAGAVVQSFR